MGFFFLQKWKNGVCFTPIFHHLSKPAFFNDPFSVRHLPAKPNRDGTGLETTHNQEAFTEFVRGPLRDELLKLGRL